MTKYLLITIVFLIAGCSASKIKIDGSKDRSEVYPMFGKSPSREFYNPKVMSDSLLVKWEAEANGSFHQNSVTYFGRNIFVNDLSGRVYCYDLDNGKIKGQLKHKGAVYTTPVIHGYNVIYVETMADEDKSILRIYNFLEAKSIAEKEVNGRVFSEIILLDNQVYFLTEKGFLYKYSSVGDEYWAKNLKSSFHSSPASDGKNIFLSNDKGELLRIDGENGNIIYRKNLNWVITSGLTVIEDYIYAGDKNGFVLCFNKEDGSLLWEFKSESQLNAIPVIQDEKVYAVNLGGEVVCLDANSGEEIWRKLIGGVLNVTPLLTANYLIVPDLNGRIIMIDKNNGDNKKVLEIPNRAKLSPVIIGNILLIGYDRGILRAYEIL